MKIFYIPDGHRRYADKVGCSLVESYQIGYRVLIDELIEPLFARPDVSHLDIFLISNLNLKRRSEEDLQTLVEEGNQLLWSLVERSKNICSVRTVGTFLKQNIHLKTVPDRLLTLVLGCTTADDIGCPEVDIFLRTGGELRLSGAPRTIIGDYTQFYALDELHPSLRYAQVEQCLDQYCNRYMRELQAVGREL